MDLLGAAGPVSLAGIFATAFVVGLSGAVMPGPVLAVAIGHSARMGIKAGPLLMSGHSVLELILVAALALGLGPILAQDAVAGVIGGAGAAILLWMAIGMLRSLPGLRLDLSPADASAAGPIRDGVLLSLANPYWSLWWATVGLGFLVLARDSGWGWWGLAAFYLGHIASDMAWYTLVAALVTGGRRFISDRVYRILVAVCGVCLLVFAAYFGLVAWEKLGPA